MPSLHLVKDALTHKPAIGVLIETVVAVFRKSTQRRERPPDVSQLSSRMRRDIGLRTEHDVPDYWTL